MSAMEFSIAYACIGMAYALPKLFGFLDFLRKQPEGGLDDIPGPTWLVSSIAAAIMTSATMILIALWPAWIVHGFLTRGK